MPINISTSPLVFRSRPAAWLRVVGEDAASFLQGQLTNDLRALATAPAVYGLWLTLKGKVLADSFVLRSAAEEFWIGSYFSPGQTIRERLESHVIADDVRVEDVTGEWAGITVLGELSGAEVDAARSGQSSFIFPGRRGSEPSLECIFRVSDGPPEWLKKLKGREVDDLDMERRRIRAGIPAIPEDIGPADLPNEGGLERDAISYTKGCYLGQEVMARLKSMGRVRRRLVRVAGDDAALPARGAALFSGVRQVGELRSRVQDGERGWIGLAMVALMQLAPGASLSLAADGAPLVRVLDPL